MRIIRVIVRENRLFDLIDAFVDIRLRLGVRADGAEHLAFTRKKFTRLRQDLDGAILKLKKLAEDARLAE